MADDISILERLLGASPPEVVQTETHGRATVELYDNGTFTYLVDGTLVQRGFSSAETTDGVRFDTRRAALLATNVVERSDALGAARVVTTEFSAGQLILAREIALYPGGELVIQIRLSSTDGVIETRHLAPYNTTYPGSEARPVFLSLDQKMLRVPYDNDMWGRYESAVPDPGRESYDVTAIYDPETFEGLVVGALDFDVWKNAIRWSGLGARSITAYSGAAGLGTHDIIQHRAVSGDSVASARFVIFWSDDIKRGMEHFADLCVALHPARPWANGTVPFGWNSYSGLGIKTTVESWAEAGDFIHEELTEYRGEDDVVYVNLDGAFGLDHDEVRATVERLHARGQKAGWYAAPCGGFPGLESRPVVGTDFVMGDLFLRDYNDQVMPVIDALVPLDVTHPGWETYARTTIRTILDLGFDYIKLDFLTHGGVEGAHHLEHFTGRMALDHAYTVISDEIDAAGREIFVSLSIAPLFPYFLGHARRASCDVFGRFDDVRYVLNSQNFSWWTSGRLYSFNDPDHTPLLASAVDGREPSSDNEARSRYIASVIGGTVMMLSDDFGPAGERQHTDLARERARRLANTASVNDVARIGRAFVPVDLADGTTPYYTLTHEGRHFMAVFNFDSTPRELSFDPQRGSLPTAGRLRNLYTGDESRYQDRVAVTLEGWDAALFEVFTGLEE